MRKKVFVTILIISLRTLIANANSGPIYNFNFHNYPQNQTATQTQPQLQPGESKLEEPKVLSSPLTNEQHSSEATTIKKSISNGKFEQEKTWGPSIGYLWLTSNRKFDNENIKTGHDYSSNISTANLNVKLPLNSTYSLVPHLFFGSSQNFNSNGTTSGFGLDLRGDYMFNHHIGIAGGFSGITFKNNGISVDDNKTFAKASGFGIFAGPTSNFGIFNFGIEGRMYYVAGKNIENSKQNALYSGLTINMGLRL